MTDVRKTKAKKLPGWAFNEPEWREFKPEQTGLSAPVWIDVCGCKHEKNLRYIRFPWSSFQCLSDTLEMVICSKPYIPRSVRPHIRLSPKFVQELKRFVAKNRKILTDVGTGNIDYPTFEEKLHQSLSDV